MLYDPLLLFFLTALFSPLSFALNLPQATTLNQFNTTVWNLIQEANASQLRSNISSNVTSLSGTFGCITGSKYIPFTRRPRLRDCGGAMRRMPSLPDIAVFKLLDRTTPVYQLPEYYEEGSCLIKINFTEHALSEISTWTEIGLAAVQESIACIKGTHTGGLATCGEQNKITVDLKWQHSTDPEDGYLSEEDDRPMTDLEIYNALTGGPD